VGLALLLLAPPVGAPESLQDVLAMHFGQPTLNPGALMAGLEAGNPISV
jgi:hypothetical protein